MRRVLIVSYYFPPSGGPGVQRVLKTVRYLRDFGWEPVVLTVEEGAYPDHDPTLWDDVPPEVLVHRTPAWDPYRWYARLTGRAAREAVKVGSVAGPATWQERLARWVRANVFLPDARVGWVPFAAVAISKLCRHLSIDALLTSGPPHSVHLSGLLGQRWTGTPWVADFRDPWTDINYYHELPHSALAHRLDAALERVVLRQAAQVTTVSPRWATLLRDKVHRGREDVWVVQNGFDAADVDAVTAVPPAEEFMLTHVGSLYASRNPVALWNALARLRDRGAIPRLRLRLVGTVAPGVRAALSRRGLDARTTHVPYVPHAEAVAAMQQAHLLLLCIEAFPHDDGMITGKLYEYLASGRPVLGLGPPHGDAADLLRQTHGGQMWARDDVDAIAADVLGHYEAWERGTMRSGAAPDAIASLTRRAQTGLLADVLEAARGTAVRQRPGREVR